METRDLAALKEQILAQYKEKVGNSKKHFEEAQKWMPGGGTRNVAYFWPFPFFATKGQGAYIYDIDGNEYIDCLNNMTALIHGHAPPRVVEAIQTQVAEGTAHAAPMKIQYELARMICERTPSIEELRFCNSGTEATMFAIRAARVYTKKTKIIKTDGGYHGSHDYVEINIDPDLTTEDLPTPAVEHGVPETLLKDVFVVPFNNLAAAERVMKKHHNEIAAMIIEPLMGSGGGIIGMKEYLQGLRDLTKKYGILLIFDEVISYRMSIGGMQKLYGITPDLTALGKIIGGGFPVGAFGGRRELIEQFNPTKKNFVTHSGTFSGNAMTMVAGKATLADYDEKAVVRLNELGKRLRKGLQGILNELNIKGCVSGIGSVAYTYFFEHPPQNAKELQIQTIPFLELAKYLQLALPIQGVYALSRGVTPFILSTAMDEDIVDEIIQRYRRALEMVLPLYKDATRFHGFAGIIYSMLKNIESKAEFKTRFGEDNYSLLLVAEEDPNAIRLDIHDGHIQFRAMDNQAALIKSQKKEVDGAIITSIPTFLGLGLGKINPVKAILMGRLKLKGIKYVKKFTQYFDLI